MTRPDPGSARPAHATVLGPAREPGVEVLDRDTRDVWQAVATIAPEAWAEVELEPPLVELHSGSGTPVGAMDEHWFVRSPGADEDGPMEERRIGGYRFVLCARPVSAPELPDGPDGPRLLLVDKHHVLQFYAGRRIEILTLPDGSEYVHTIDGGAGKPPIEIPRDWSLRFVELARDWVVPLPHPTTAFFFANGDSFQGPIQAP